MEITTLHNEEIEGRTCQGCPNSSSLTLHCVHTYRGRLYFCRTCMNELGKLIRRL